MTKTKLIAKFYRLLPKSLNIVKFTKSLDSTSLGVPLASFEDDYIFHRYFLEHRDNLWFTSHLGGVKILDIDTLNKMEIKFYDQLEESSEKNKYIYEKYLSIFEKIFDNLEDDDSVIYLWNKCYI